MNRLQIFGLILLLVSILSPGWVLAQTVEWTKYDNTTPANSDLSSTNGKIPLGTNGKGDDAQVIYPSVLRDGSTYKMWYGPSDGTWSRIYYATSSNGLDWTKYDNNIPVSTDSGVASTNGKIPLGTTGKGDDNYALAPSVLKDDSPPIYKMWYSGNAAGISRIYYATSSNGLEWTKYDNNIPANSDSNSTGGRIPLGTTGKGDDAQVSYPSVLKDGSTYKMWYGAHDGTKWRIYYATSSNGLDWTKYDNTVPTNSDGTSTNGRIPLGTAGKGDDVHVFGPSVIKDGSIYKMWYGGQGGTTNYIYCATSPDGLTWTKLDNTIPPASDTTNSNSRIALGTAGKGDNRHVVYQTVVVFDDELGRHRYYQMWYSGHDGANWRIYYATYQVPPPAGTIFTLK